MPKLKFEIGEFDGSKNSDEELVKILEADIKDFEKFLVTLGAHPLLTFEKKVILGYLFNKYKKKW